jgi:nicotinate-nucleotide adenylyltransferase
MSKKKIALLGGGFDPVSLHHEFIAEEVKRLTGMSTWFMPCWNHLFSKNERLLDANHRWNMVVLAADNRCDDTIIPFDWEIKNQHSGSMYETTEQLKIEYPDTEIYLVVGTDNANIIETKWDRGQSLIENNPFIVFDRPGYPPKVDWFMREPHRFFTMDYDLSSSEIRNAIKNGEFDFAQQHLNPAVWTYIQSGQFYREA